MKYGYVRVSTKEQNIDRQMTVMKELGIAKETIFIDKACNMPMSSLIRKSVLSQKLVVAGNEKVRQIIIERLKIVGTSLQKLVSEGYIEKSLMDEIKLIDRIKTAWE
ncbi:resolvase, N-terminal domain protein [Eubacterium nodatum ATCC 33099]|nr:resolvase, N-terminal domain protein [Eubacterium nodatum ATCC 33099]